MSNRSLRHPFGGNSYLKPPRRKAPRRAKVRQPRIREPRRRVNVSGIVAPPEETPGRPILRLRIVGLVVLILFGVMVLRLWTLQVIHTKTYAAAVTQNQVRTVTVPAPRGEITDRNGVILVGNTVSQQIVFSRLEATEHPSMIGKVAALVGQSPGQIENALKDSQYSPYEPVPVFTESDPATAQDQAVVQYLLEHQSQYPGVSVESVTQRQYPQGGETAAHVLGYVTSITGTELKALKGQGYSQSSQIGQAGLEAEYEHYLRGRPGRKVLEVNAQGNVVGVLHETKPEQGNTLVTNLDTGLQQEVQNALASDIATDATITDTTTGKKPQPTDGAAIVLDPNNGQVLAMASDPTYDLDDWVGGITQAEYDSIANDQTNYAIQGRYTPGSTFKLVTSTAALQTGLITANTPFDDSGTFTVPGCTGGAASGCQLKDEDAPPAGTIELPEALTISDDAFFYNLGAMFWDARGQYGDTPIQNVGSDYGLVGRTGIDLPNEVNGWIDSQAVDDSLHKEAPNAYAQVNWNTGSNIEMAFGQGATDITPIGLATAYATFANGGTRYQPQVASAVVSPNGKVVKQFEPKVTGHVSLPPNVYQPILQGLEGVVEPGTGGTASQTFAQYAHFSLDQFRIAGKTGTADIGDNREPNAWFVGFGPIPNPQYVVLVVVDQAGYGAQAAAPAVMNIFNYLVTNPIGPVKLPTKASPPTTVAAPSNPPAGTPAPTTTTTTPGATTTTATTAPAG